MTSAELYRQAAALLGKKDRHHHRIEVACHAIRVAVRNEYQTTYHSDETVLIDQFAEYFKPIGIEKHDRWFGSFRSKRNLNTRRLALLLMADIMENLQ